VGKFAGIAFAALVLEEISTWNEFIGVESLGHLGIFLGNNLKIFSFLFLRKGNEKQNENTTTKQNMIIY